MPVYILGEAMLELHSRGSEGGLRYGGDTLNTAIHLARLGHDVCYITAVGTDPISDALVAIWEGEGIDTRYVLRHPSRQPGIYAIHLEADGERSFLYWRGESAARDMFALPGMAEALAAAKNAPLLYLSLISLAILPEDARSQMLALMTDVREAGGHVAYDSNFRANLWPSLSEARAVSDRAIAAATIGLPTNTDECELAGHSLDEMTIARRWQDLGCAEIVVKAGAKGCLAASADAEAEMLATTPLTMVDASGAGDAFNAGYLSARLHGHDQKRGVRSGQNLAGWVIQRQGAIPPVEGVNIYRQLADAAT